MMVEHHESVLMRKSRVKLATSLKCTQTKRLQSRNIHFERAKIKSRWLAEHENGYFLTCHFFVSHTLSEMENFKFQFYVAY